MTQALIGELFEKDVRTINEHLVNIFDEGELRREATIRKFRIVRTEGARQITRQIEHYNLDAILAVGWRFGEERGKPLNKERRYPIALTMRGLWGSGLARFMSFPWTSADGFRRSLSEMPRWGGRKGPMVPSGARRRRHP